MLVKPLCNLSIFLTLRGINLSMLLNAEKYAARLRCHLIKFFVFVLCKLRGGGGGDKVQKYSLCLIRDPESDWTLIDQ